jgi:ferric-dicitrate binding protein FerR (iron transport regulator)
MSGLNPFEYMKKYEHYRAVDFAEDEEFIQWVKRGTTDDALHLQWTLWLEQNLDKREIIDEARNMVQTVLHEKQYVLSDQRKNEMWSHIQESVHQISPEKSEPYSVKVPWYNMAAVLVVVVLAGLYVFYHFQANPATNSPTAFIPSTQGLKQFKNETGQPQMVTLDDGSRVTLQPQSLLAYPEKFVGHQRKVYLSGEAFFLVEKDPKRPFFVYANELVTQVLGTSFNVRAYSEERDISVVVRTGKVSVFSLSKEEGNLKTGEGTNALSKVMNRTLLLPNQQVVFSRDRASLIKSLVLEPVVLPAPVVLDFEFTDTPIREVFEKLSKAYGVDIVYDEEVLGNCYLNASLDDLSFHDKLRLICKAINAQYEMLDAEIIITGNGCQ